LIGDLGDHGGGGAVGGGGGDAAWEEVAVGQEGRDQQEQGHHDDGQSSASGLVDPEAEAQKDEGPDHKDDPKQNLVGHGVTPIEMGSPIGGVVELNKLACVD